MKRYYNNESGPFTREQWDYLVRWINSRPEKKIRKNFAAYIEVSRAEMEEIDSVIARLQSKCDLSKWDVISKIFLRGLSVARAELEEMEESE